MDDETGLVLEMTRRDRTAWDAMYQRHVGDVYGVVYHLVGGDRHLAEDVNQEVWLLTLERLGQFDPEKGRFRDWLLGIARHRAMRHHRRITLQAIEESPEGVAAISSPPELLEGEERDGAVCAALLCLRRESRQVLLDKYADGLSVEEIASRSGRPAKGVESLLSRARVQLRAPLRPYCSHPMGGLRREPTDARPT
jgi:RNA polymerase sigma-70 factor (ECF subfamily)